MLRRFILCLLMLHWLCMGVIAQTAEVDSILNLIKKSSEDTNKVNHYRNLSGVLRFTDPTLAIVYGKKGFTLSEKLGYDKGTAGCYMNVSTAYIYSDKLDSALHYIDIALRYAHHVGDEKRLGLAYLNRADIYRQQQNFSQAMKNCDTSLVYADRTNNDDVRARINQTIGSIYYQQEIYPSSIEYYDKAAKLYRKVGNLRMSAVVLNNISLVQKSLKEFSKAIRNESEAIRITDSLKDITNLSIFNGNLSDVYFEMGNYLEAERYANKALEYAQMQNNEKLKALSWNFQGNIYAKQKRIPESIQVLEKAFAIFVKLDATDRIQTTSDLLAEVYASNGQTDKAYKYILISKTANDSLVKWRYDDDVTAMQTKFQVKEKDREIQLLAKDKELQALALSRQKLLITSIVIALISVMIIGFLVVNRYRVIGRSKRLIEIERMRNTIARDLHDDIGSTLSSINILSQVALAEKGDNSQNYLQRIGDQSARIMEDMSDIVWSINPHNDSMSQIIIRMREFSTELFESKNIDYQFSEKVSEGLTLDSDKRKNLFLIFKETINNAAKYSNASKIEIKLSQIDHTLVMSIKDNGQGFDEHTIKSGNGLRNLRERAREINGIVTLKSVVGEGTEMELRLPIA